MNFVSIRLITADVAGLVAFYERVTGVRADWANENFAEIRTTSATLAIASTRTVAVFGPGSAHPADNHSADNHSADNHSADNRSVIIEFLVDDVDSVYQNLTGLLDDVVTEPTTMPWGNRSLLFRDPDGNLVNFFTPVTPAAIEKFAPLTRDHSRNS